MLLTTAKKLQLLTLCGLVLLIIRVVQTQTLSYVFLIWNVALAYLPYKLSKWCIRDTQPALKRLYSLGAIIFLPNAPYLITDLFHLQKREGIPLWFDLILLCLFSAQGIIYFIASTNYLVYYFKRQWSKLSTYVIILVLALLSAYGIYLGRYLRFNSWDVLTRPLYLIHQISNSLFHPTYYKETWSVTFAFAGFLILIYILFLPTHEVHHKTHQRI